MSGREVVVRTGDTAPSAVSPASFSDLSKSMEEELENRRYKWEQEVSELQTQFFNSKIIDSPSRAISGTTKPVELVSESSYPARRSRGANEIFDISHAKTLYSDNPDGSRVFKMRFDVKGYAANEIKIGVTGRKLSVTAQAEQEIDPGNKSVKNFNRHVDIPTDVDVDRLASFLSADGILSVEAPAFEKDEESSDQVYGDDEFINNNGARFALTIQGDVDVEKDNQRYNEIQQMRANLLAPASIAVNPPNYHTVMTGHVHKSSPGNVYTSRTVGGTSPILYHTRTTREVPDTGISYNVTRVHSGPCHTCHAGKPREPLKTHRNPAKSVNYKRSVSPHSGSTVIQYSNKPILGASKISGGYNLVSPVGSFKYNEPTILSTEEGRRMKMVVDIGREYSNDDVRVTIKGGSKIDLHAHKEESSSGRTSKREFSREFYSPEEIDPSTVRAVLAGDGRLTIAACVKGNAAQANVMQLVACDMPLSGKACHVSVEN